jgi:hypothetical protein
MTRAGATTLLAVATDFQKRPEGWFITDGFQGGQTDVSGSRRSASRNVRPAAPPGKAGLLDDSTGA